MSILELPVMLIASQITQCGVAASESVVGERLRANARVVGARVIIGQFQNSMSGASLPVTKAGILAIAL